MMKVYVFKTIDLQNVSFKVEFTIFYPIKIRTYTVNDKTIEGENFYDLLSSLIP